ncbi:hypothetical protein PR202_gb27009 [Eleusine coracana subsp. coracana]|uniref:Peptidase S54 rhomboid domain-containing protein n=1 Tax=Eleusine coracana subsp. coracana TaxID=191504 RepID=A0AAV5FT76_ELECO|nr:hypothetical protein PR202_gb27009 [Eleusine coracana subsp. coracana]
MGAGMSNGWRRRGFVVERPERSRGLLPLLALQVLLEYGRVGATRPPVTAALLAANTLVYLRPGALHELLPSLTRISFSPHLIIEYGDWMRFFLSPFYHLSETHLFYNMTSLLWKGIQLETSVGSAEFASMVAALLGLSQGITLLLSKGLLLLGDDTSYFSHAAGFSGVLFGMKVVLNAWSDDFVYLHGMVIPSKYAAWAELILIQAFIPDTSFIGHLGGILAGLVYLWLKRIQRVRPTDSSDLKRYKGRVLASKICSENSKVFLPPRPHHRVGSGCGTGWGCGFGSGCGMGWGCGFGSGCGRGCGWGLGWDLDVGLVVAAEGFGPSGAVPLLRRPEEEAAETTAEES